ncbi:hypothetical protein L0657_21515 [Dyadobacter sp. CY345]|uniref:hypothetical protein n=1 Tax=Dyadobacter sp. CY345 TaxID=2909335 RepID=UPI001F30F71D|nr:hypothetical protein [Dyadobacter sp. CY345]MCF2446550.1 hypothetical protein [Dyadobacter sp. CY345]
MKNLFENSLPVGLVMSLYEFDIPAENKVAVSNASRSSNVRIITETELHDDIHDHVWMNGELSWKL